MCWNIGGQLQNINIEQDGSSVTAVPRIEQPTGHTGKGSSIIIIIFTSVQTIRRGEGYDFNVRFFNVEK